MHRICAKELKGCIRVHLYVLPACKPNLVPQTFVSLDDDQACCEACRQRDATLCRSFIARATAFLDSWVYWHPGQARQFETKRLSPA